jgi:hypothetical protein
MRSFLFDSPVGHRRQVRLKATEMEEPLSPKVSFALIVLADDLRHYLEAPNWR